ncbi:MAG: hypothetical protein A3H96_15580 [Acidobacteria bacterium RIFCSPLOWO2_02_FULL_67_36]|nr:MAG: hypothetical protein A3H96_15580 [Acidobacteria bacterium RIFCSPLOWO2_02_FULL_67_36]OFW19428.1 MAG: hypothetical protein A3G21_15750 [Acidobacteria bacterium RIFCSPLOWO2_12_FULL_66_21]
MARDIDAEIQALLPLAPAFLHILIALGEGERHGYAVMQEVADRTAGRVKMSPGTLYGSIKRMLAEGLIEELTTGAAGADERRRFYRITKFGRRVAAAEAERLTSLLLQAHDSGLVRGDRSDGATDLRRARVPPPPPLLPGRVPR